ncbi:cytochrome b/b6 domain-containing protein [bacterium]|nr:cytochrome b/b6 domain-containing protein [bacterium]
MESTRIYDVPTRIFHVLFAALFIIAWSIGNTIDDDSALFAYHMIAGLLLAFVVMLRIFWGFTGSRHARFSSFPLNPKELFTYFKNIFSTSATRYSGHNPASSWAAIIMMGLAVGLGITGFLMTQYGEQELLEELHELLANTFIVIVLLHIAGVMLHTLKHRDAIGMSMLHGKKLGISASAGITKSHVMAGILFLSLISGFAFYLNKNYDSASRTLTLAGITLNLGEAEEGNDSGLEQNDEHEDRDDD